MHELSITQSIVSTVVERMRDAPIKRVKVEIGRLSGIVPDAVHFCFEMASTGTTLEGAKLEIVELPGKGRCRDCGTEFDTNDPLPLCDACDSADIELLGGQELRIREVEVA
ncbi:MAG: hydrogenase nickel incorporation protein [Pseudonocardia sp.]|nr:hydrogenase nickel incorporation protein [Pseudonocardia sp.]